MIPRFSSLFAGSVDQDDTLLQRNEVAEGHVPAGRVPGHLQRTGDAAPDGAGLNQALNYLVLDNVIRIPFKGCPRLLHALKWRICESMNTKYNVSHIILPTLAITGP